MAQPSQPGAASKPPNSPRRNWSAGFAAVIAVPLLVALIAAAPSLITALRGSSESGAEPPDSRDDVVVPSSAGTGGSASAGAQSYASSTPAASSSPSEASVALWASKSTTKTLQPGRSQLAGVGSINVGDLAAHLAISGVEGVKVAAKRNALPTVAECREALKDAGNYAVPPEQGNYMCVGTEKSVYLLKVGNVNTDPNNTCVEVELWSPAL